MLRNTRVVCNAFIGCLLAATLLFNQASALEPKHEMRRLMLATEEAVKNEKWTEASEYLNRLQQMQQQKPADYLYYRGRVMLESGQLNEAQSALEEYVGSAGAEGQHYTDALTLITQVERARKNERSISEKVANADAEPVAVIEPAGDATVDELRQLYLADSDSEALLIHLNSILDRAGWRKDSRVVRLDQPADVSYRVTRLNDSINIQEARRESSGRVIRTTESLVVFGVNPQIEWSCEPTTATCWVYDPRDGSRLMKLRSSRADVAEVANTLGRLIKHMQAPR